MQIKDSNMPKTEHCEVVNDGKYEVNTIYGNSFIKPEMLMKIIPLDPPTWKERLAIIWHDLRQIIIIAVMFMCWSFSMAMMFKLVDNL